MCSRILCLAYQKLSNCYLLCAMWCRLVSVAHPQTPYPNGILLDGFVYFWHMLLSLLISRISYAGKYFSNGRATSIFVLVLTQRVRTKMRERETEKYFAALDSALQCFQILNIALQFFRVVSIALDYFFMPLLQPYQTEIEVVVNHFPIRLRAAVPQQRSYYIHSGFWIWIFDDAMEWNL